jgi:hypothetical protein
MHTYAYIRSQTSALIENLDSKHFPREHGLVKPVQPHEQHGFLQLGSGPQTALPRAWLRFWGAVPLSSCGFHFTIVVGVISQLKEVITIVITIVTP